MPEAWTKLRSEASDAVGTLIELLENQDSDDRRLIAGYLEAKRALAGAFEAYSVERYADPSIMEQTKVHIENEMARRYAALPAKYLKVRGYGESHARLLAYLTRRVGEQVAADELRMLTRDAVHTERRARELRDLGFALQAVHTGGVDMYTLTGAAPNLAAASKYQLRKNLKDDKSLTTEQSAALLREADSS